jgi:hypothetical protein
MAINDDVFRAILAMDAYNRGYNAGIAGLGGEGTQLGTAVLAKNAEQLLGPANVQSASFFAQA